MAEGLAIIAQLTILRIIDKVWNIKGKVITVYSDCESVLKKVRLRADDRVRFALENDIDIILEIRSMIASMKCQIRLQYVKSHQDRHISFQEAPFPQQLNILMDEQVRVYIDKNVDETPRKITYPVLESVTAVIGSRNAPLIADIENEMISRYYEKDWIEYSWKQFGLTKNALVEFDGSYVAKAMRSCKESSQQITKIIHGQHHTMAKSKQWGSSSTATCPLCSAPCEGRFHMLECPHKCMQQIRSNEKLALAKGLQKAQTDETIMSIIEVIVNNWNDSEGIERRINDLNLMGSKWNDLIQSQKSIGWRNFMLGICSSEFGKRQEEWYRDQGVSSSFSGETWTRKLLKLLWQVLQRLWKERCKVVHEENDLTAEKRYRTLLWEQHEQLRQQVWRFSPQDRNLIQKTKKFFQEAPYRNVEIWQRQVNLATSTAKFQSQQRTRDIREFFGQYGKTWGDTEPHVRKEKKATSKFSFIPSQVTYRQLKLKFRKAQKEVADKLEIESSMIVSRSRREKCKRKMTYDGEKEYIRNWLGVSKGKRRLKLNKKCAINFVNNYYMTVGESSRHAVPSIGTRKIRNFTD